MTSTERAALRNYLAEDFDKRGDITSRSLLSAQQTVRTQLVAQETAVLAGMPYMRELFRMGHGKVQVRARLRDGQTCKRGTVIAEVTGSARAIFLVERTAMNLLGHVSGVATMTRRYAEKLQGTHTKLYDTRKTHPGLRQLEKYGVQIGGGTNHRLTLSDLMMIKTNHLKALDMSRPRAITLALRIARRRYPRASIMVEATTHTEVAMAIIGRASTVLLDNMTIPALRKAVQLRNRLNRCVVLEASGGITLRDIRRIALTGVERISVGTITKSAPTIDFALRVQS